MKTIRICFWCHTELVSTSCPRFRIKSRMTREAGFKTFQKHSNLVYNNTCMNKYRLNKTLLIMLYGYPGSGKTYFARQLAEDIGATHLSSDRLRYELFETPRYDKQENDIIDHLMEYMAEEFLKVGVSVIYDSNAMRFGQRRNLRDLARRSHAEQLLVWVQTDQTTSFARLGGRDRRKSDDKYAAAYDGDGFESYIQQMQNPQNEEYVVISGKHTFTTQSSAIIKKFYDSGLIDAESANSKVIKPGLVNLIPSPAAGRVDMSRRNIRVR